MTTNNTNPTEAPDAGDELDELLQDIMDIASHYNDTTYQHANYKTMHAHINLDQKLQAIRTKYVPISQDQLQKFEIAHHDALKGIDDYRRFKDSEDEFERMTAWIHQLSPWNLQNGVDALRSKYTSRDEVEQLATDFDLPSITQWEQGEFIDSKRYNHMADSWKAEQRRREQSLIRPGGGTNNGLFVVGGVPSDEAAKITAYLEALGKVLRRELGLGGNT